MIRKFLYICAFLSPFIFTAEAYAEWIIYNDGSTSESLEQRKDIFESTAKRSHALAMHGNPKYSESDTHLSYANPNAAKGGTIKQATTGSFDTLNALNIKGKPASGLHLLYDSLAARIWDEPFTLYGLIAESIEIDQERSAIRFNLNPKAVFHDEHPILVEDVLFSLETLKAYGRPNTRRIYSLIEAAYIYDERSVTFFFGEGFDRETALIIAMMRILPKHYWQGRNFDETTLEAPLGSGPYKIESLDVGRSIQYQKATDYWAQNHLVNNGHHNADHLRFDYYRDKNVAIQAFKAGEFDFWREFNPSDWYNNFISESDKNESDYIARGLPHQRPEMLRGLIFNTRTPYFENPLVREALSLAFDFERMNTTLFRGAGKRITSTFPNTSLAAPKIISDNEKQLFQALLNEGSELPFTLDAESSSETVLKDRRARLRRADQLLKEAGWIVEDGIRVHKDSKLPFTFTVISSSPEFEKIVLNYAQSLKRLGITLNLRSVDSAQFVSLLNQYDYDMILHRWINSLSPGTEQMIYWGCDAAENPGSRNYSRLCHPAVDALAQKVPQSLTREELEASIHALDRTVMALHPLIPFYYIGEDYIAHKPEIKIPDHIGLYGVVSETFWVSPAQE